MAGDCLGTEAPLTLATPTAYREKMKELSVLSLICSCLSPRPHPNTIYQYGGECPGPRRVAAHKGPSLGRAS